MKLAEISLVDLGLVVRRDKGGGIRYVIGTNCVVHPASLRSGMVNAFPDCNPGIETRGPTGKTTCTRM